MNLKREPALILAAVLAVLQLAVGFGLEVSTDQQGLIVAAVAAVLSLLTGAAVRARVTPLAAPRAEDGSYLITTTEARRRARAGRYEATPDADSETDDLFPQVGPKR